MCSPVRKFHFGAREAGAAQSVGIDTDLNILYNNWVSEPKIADFCYLNVQ